MLQEKRVEGQIPFPEGFRAEDEWELAVLRG